MKTIFYLLLLLILPSCEMKSDESFAGRNEETTADINIIAGECGFKETGIDNDSYIKDLNIYIFDREERISLHQFQSGNRIQIELPYNENSAYEIYAIANYGSDLKLNSRQEVMMAEYRIRSAEDIGKESGLAIMSGQTAIDRIYNGKNIYMQLSRIVSRINVFLETSGLYEDVTLEIDSIQICNMNPSTPFFRPGRVRPDSETLKMDGKPVNGNRCTFYVMENMQGNLLPGISDEKKKVFEENDARARLCTYIKIKGRYSSRAHSGEIRYRFYLGKNILENFDIERNHSYDITVNFTGTGINEVSWRVDVSDLKDHVSEITIHPESHNFTSYVVKKQFSYTLLPENAVDKRVRWRTSDASVCQVDQNGMVFPRGQGTCRISVISIERPEIRDSAIVSCTARIPIDQILIHPKRENISIGQTLQLDYMTNPPNATRPKEPPVWKSSNTSVIRVEDGLLTPIKEGKATITLEVTTKEGVFSDRMPIRVVKEYLSISELPVLYPGQQHYVSVHSSIPGITPSISSSNTYVATISDNDLITAVSSGKATITATYDQLIATRQLTVRDPVLELDRYTVRMGIDDQGTVKVLHSEPYETRVEWRIDHPEIAGINVQDKGNTCRLTGLRKGSTTLHAVIDYADGHRLEKDVAVEVSYAPMSEAEIKMVYSEGRYDKENPDQLVDSRYTFSGNCFKVYGVEIHPANADPEYNVTWSVSADDGDPVDNYIERMPEDTRTYTLIAKEFPKRGINRPKRGMITLKAEITNSGGETLVAKRHIRIYEFLPLVPAMKSPIGAEIDFRYFHVDNPNGYFVLNLLKDGQPYLWPEKIRNGPPGCWITPILSEKGYDISECFQTNSEDFEIKAPLGGGDAFASFIRSLSVHRDYHYNDNLFVYVDLVFPPPAL